MTNVEDLINVFSAELSNEDTVEPQPEDMYLTTIIRELESIMEGHVDSGFSDREVLLVAASRIPGLLHLYTLYGGVVES